MSNLSTFTPTVGIKGKYTVAPPFDSVISSSKSYTCVRVQDYSSATIDLDNMVYEKIYQPYNLSIETMTIHMNSGVYIVTLEDDSGKYYYIPSNYIVGFPNSDTITYTCVMVTAQIGAVPNNVNLEEIKNDIEDIVNEKYGIISQVNLVRYGTDLQVNPATHAAIEHIRARNKIVKPSSISTINQLTFERDKYKQQLDTLVKYLKDNNLIQVN